MQKKKQILFGIKLRIQNTKDYINQIIGNNPEFLKEDMITRNLSQILFQNQ